MKTTRSPTIRIKRVYEPPSRDDGQRILVERLWPRGLTKEALKAQAWMKEVAPSTALRRWFGHRVERWEEFRRRYREELDANRAAWAPLAEAHRRGTLTLLYSARDEEHNGAVVLRDYLLRRRAGRAPAGRVPRASPRAAAHARRGAGGGRTATSRRSGHR